MSPQVVTHTTTGQVLLLLTTLDGACWVIPLHPRAFVVVDTPAKVDADDGAGALVCLADRACLVRESAADIVNVLRAHGLAEVQEL